MLKIEFEFETLEEAAAAIQALAARRGTPAMPSVQPPPSLPVAKPVPPSPAAPTAPAPTSVPVPTVTPLAVPPPAIPTPTVPVAAAPTYNRDQIMTAGAALIDGGKMNELMGLLNTFGVQAVTQLKQEQLGAFATELRKLGAQI